METKEKDFLIKVLSTASRASSPKKDYLIDVMDNCKTHSLMEISANQLREYIDAQGLPLKITPIKETWWYPKKDSWY